MVTFDFAGQVVIVTGAARGVGRVMVHAFAGAGAYVVAADRDEPGLTETCAPLGGTVVPVVADISSAEGANAVVGAAVEKFGRLDVCVNNAAVAPHTALLEERVEVWDRVYAVNCRGTFLMTQAAARAMIAGQRGGRDDSDASHHHASGVRPLAGGRDDSDASHHRAIGVRPLAGGRIINFSSGASQRGGPGAAAYASSRAAVESFSRVAAVELAPHNILVNTISPGLIDTQPKPLPPLMAENLGRRIPNMPLARPGEPEEVANVVLFLASDASSYISGSVVHVDGASSAGNRYSGQVVDVDPRYDWVTGRTA
jgi:NAD(P)-dependent dehydrogenase (short-subunit alcohol dehydrogenase family)